MVRPGMESREFQIRGAQDWWGPVYLVSVPVARWDVVVVTFFTNNFVNCKAMQIMNIKNTRSKIQYKLKRCTYIAIMKLIKRWWLASVVVAIRTRTESGERIVRQTALSSVTVWQTAQQIGSTIFVSRITHKTHCTNSELGVSPRFTALSICIHQRLTWKCREIAPPVWTQRWSRDFSSFDSKRR